MKFVPNLHHTEFYAATEIVSYGRRTKYVNSIGHYYHMKLRDGREITVDEHAIQELEASFIGVLPATTGTSIISVYHSDGDPSFHRTPVVAWAFKLDGEPVPITPNGPDDHMFRDMPVEMPDGHVFPRFSVDAGEFDTVEDYVAEVKREREADALKAFAASEAEPGK